MGPGPLHPEQQVLPPPHVQIPRQERGGRPGQHGHGAGFAEREVKVNFRQRLGVGVLEPPDPVQGLHGTHRQADDEDGVQLAHLTRHRFVGQEQPEELADNLESQAAGVETGNSAVVGHDFRLRLCELFFVFQLGATLTLKPVLAALGGVGDIDFRDGVPEVLHIGGQALV